MTSRSARPPLELAIALVADLRDLAVDLAEGGYTRTTLAMLDRDLRRCVPSALGATVSLVRGPDRTPLQIHLVSRTLEPDEVRATLRIPLRGPDPAVDASITLYASRVVAFADLAADLTDSLRVLVDQRPNLPQSPVEPGTSGLPDLTLVNIALGRLLNRGRTLAQARAELNKHATHHHTDLAGAARLLLDRSSY